MKAHRIPLLFDLAQTLDCGQAFRWREREDGSWEGCAFGKYLLLKKEGEELSLSCNEEEYESVWRAYFDADADYPLMRSHISGLSPALEEAVEYAPGIRILRQEPFEALCSFLISQNNNIPRIKGIIERFCALLGEPVGDTGFYSFPAPERLAQCTAEDLAPIRAGFRAKYLVDAGRKICDGTVDLYGIYESSAEHGRQELQKILGVGPKVAECVLLYGFHKMECFPVDVWIKRAMEQLFPQKKPEDFGAHAGLAQQYIFHYSRMHPELFKTEED